MPSACVDLFESQFGTAATWQLVERGLSRDAVRTRRQLEAVTPCVWRVIGSADTEEQRQMVTLLDAGPGSVLAQATASAHWTWAGFEVEPIDVMVVRPKGGRPKRTALGTVHYTRRLPDTHVAVLGPFRITTPARTLFDLAASMHPDRIERLVDRAWAMRQVSYPQLDRTLRELAGRGRAGIQVMRTLIEDRGPSYRPPDSNLEARFELLMRDAGITTLRRQAESGSATDWLGRIDFRDERYPLVVQIDSELYHSSISDVARDQAQTAALDAAGYIVVRIREHDVWHRPGDVVRAVRDGLNAARQVRRPA